MKLKKVQVVWKLKTHPGSRLVTVTEYKSGSLRMKFIEDCKPYKKDDTVVVLPHEVESVKNWTEGPLSS